MIIQMIIQMILTLLIDKSKQKLLKVNIITEKYEKDNNFFNRSFVIFALCICKTRSYEIIGCK